MKNKTRIEIGSEVVDAEISTLVSRFEMFSIQSDLLVFE